MADLPRVLLLGDSIRMSYQPRVARLLAGKAEVVGPADNCQFSLYTLSSLARWIGELGQPDIVHWNNGIHDCGHNMRRSPIQIPLTDYLGCLGHILEALRQHTDRIVWATTTPVHPDRDWRDGQWVWHNVEIDEYNRVATDLMTRRGVPINDLHGLVWERYAEYLAEDRLHLSDAGQEACAQAVAAVVEPLLA